MPPTLADRARQLNLGARRRMGEAAPKGLPHLFMLTDPRVPDPLAAAEVLPRGAAVVLRHYDDSDRRSLGHSLACVCRRRGLTFLVAADWRLADALNADGLHLPEGLARHGILAPALHWLRRKDSRLLTVAAHSRRAAERGASIGADAVLLSPVFPTLSHPGGTFLGAIHFAVAAKTFRTPVVALGGVTARTSSRLPPQTPWGVAAVGEFQPGK